MFKKYINTLISKYFDEQKPNIQSMIDKSIKEYHQLNHCWKPTEQELLKCGFISSEYRTPIFKNVKGFPVGTGFNSISVKKYTYRNWSIVYFNDKNVFQKYVFDIAWWPVFMGKMEIKNILDLKKQIKDFRKNVDKSEEK